MLSTAKYADYNKASFKYRTKANRKIIYHRPSLALSQPKIPKSKRMYFLRTHIVSRKISVNKRGKQRRQISARCEEARANVTDEGGERASKRSATSGIIVRL